MKDSDRLEQLKKRFKHVSDSESGQRLREIEDLRFQVGEYQWDEASRQQRAGGMITGVNFPLPPRPILSIPKLDQPIQLVTNQMRQAHLGVNIHPLSEDANKETAEVQQGLYRRIEQKSRADLARYWAFDRATKAGRGNYRVDVRFCDEDPRYPFDLDVYIDRILYQQDVYLDPSANQPDWSDGRYAFVTRWYPIDEYKEEFGDSDVTRISGLEFANAYQSAPDWTYGDGDNKSILVAEYFVKDRDEMELVLLDNGLVITSEDDIPKGRTVKARRSKATEKVRWFKTNGVEILDSEDWLGKYIPIIPVPAKELQPFDDERRWQGIIGPAKDAQRLFNFSASAAAELVALEPKAPYVMDPEQIEGYEAWWQQANIRNFPYLPYNAKSDATGKQFPPPMRTQVDTGKLGPTMMLLQQADQFIQAATATPDASLGRYNETQSKSGKAILALQGQSDAATSGYLQNFSDVAMTYEAKVVLDLLPKVYNRPGRIAEILDGEENATRVMLNIPYQMDREGNPQPVRDGSTQNAKEYNLARGSYGVSVQIGKSYQTRLQQGADEIGQMLPNLPPEMQVLFLPTYLRFRDTPGAKEMADMAAKFRDKNFPGISDKEGEQPSPEQLQSRLQAAMAQIQQMQQQLQQAGMMIQTDAAKQQATTQKAQMDAQVKTQQVQTQAATAVEVARINSETQLAIAQMKAGTDVILAKLDAQYNRIEGLVNAAHEARMSREDKAHELAMHSVQTRAGEMDQARQMGHEAGMAAGQRRHDAALTAAQMQANEQESEAERQHESEMAETAAKRAQEQADGGGE